MDIRKAKVLRDRAREKTEEMNLDDNDLVLVETEIYEGKPPEYEITKIEGSPTQFIKEHISDSSEKDDTQNLKEVRKW